MSGELKQFICAACKREFESTQEDVDLAAGHLCMAADSGLTQHEAIMQFAGMLGVQDLDLKG